MSWLIPKSTHQAALDRISELKERLTKAEEELKIEKERLADLMACRAIGQTIYGRIVPPKEEEVEEPKPEDPVRLPTPLESDMEKVGNNARALARRAESRSRAEIEESERALELARLVGLERAEATNGNH
jgi:hypothetical protein